MLNSRILTGALVTAAFTVASLFAAAPASAATLPEGQKISVADWDTFQWSNATPAGALTDVGTGGIPSEDEWLEGVDVDNKGLGYAITTAFVPGPLPDDCDPQEENDPDCDVFIPNVPDGAYLYSADANDGTIAYIDQIYILTGSGDESLLVPADSCFAIDYSGGAILAACNLYDEEGDSAWIGYIDPESAELTPYLLLAGEGFIEFSAIAVNPIDGTIWGFSYYEVYLLDIEGEEVGADFQFEYEDTSIQAADFDSSGQLWAAAEVDSPPVPLIEPGESGLVTVNADETFGNNEAWSDQGAIIHSLTVWGAALPATGPADSPAPMVAIALLLMGGTILAGVTVLRRRSLTVESD